MWGSVNNHVGSLVPSRGLCSVHGSPVIAFRCVPASCHGMRLTHHPPMRKGRRADFEACRQRSATLKTLTVIALPPPQTPLRPRFSLRNIIFRQHITRLRHHHTAQPESRPPILTTMCRHQRPRHHYDHKRVTASLSKTDVEQIVALWCYQNEFRFDVRAPPPPPR